MHRAIAAGMNNPANLYLVARQCLACHTSPNERLVNVGGHPTGSPDFELVAWSQGMVRHNFVRSEGRTNEASSRERLRMMFVVGVMADLEASLRATAAATEKSMTTSAPSSEEARSALVTTPSEPMPASSPMSRPRPGSWSEHTPPTIWTSPAA
jgi:hypothetical protein